MSVRFYAVYFLACLYGRWTIAAPTLLRIVDRIVRP